MTREEAIAILQTMEYELSNQVGSTYCRKKYDAVRIAIKALEKEPILDKIRAEILEEHESAYAREDYDTAYGLGLALDIIDKYKAEQEKT